MTSVAHSMWPVRLMLIVAAWLMLAVPGQAQNLDFPPLSGRVVDQARLLDPALETALTTKLAALETDTGNQLVVVTVDSLQGVEIEDYGYRLGRHWGIGGAEADDGVLLIVAPNERKVRIEVGYGLEPVLTDALSAQIIHNRILPAFRTGAFQRGISDGADALIDQLRLDPVEAQARAAAARPVKADPPIGPMIVVALVFVFLFLGLMGAAGRGGRRRRDGLAPVLIWVASQALSQGGRGGGGGFRGGGGGFSGGGGSFGGGGASGGW